MRLTSAHGRSGWTSDYLIFLFILAAFEFGILTGFHLWGSTFTIHSACLSFHHVTSGVSQVVRVAGHVYANMEAKACGAG